MGKDGTSIPGDAGKQRIIPSVPKPGQGIEDNQGLGDVGAGVADNAVDIPRNNADKGGIGEAITGMGDNLGGELNTVSATGARPFALKK